MIDTLVTVDNWDLHQTEVIVLIDLRSRLSVVLRERSSVAG